MAAVENLEILVDVDVSQALAKLTKLEEELGELAATIESVDSVGEDGITIDTDLESISDDLAQLQAKKEAFEKSNGITLGTDVADNLGELFDAQDRGASEIFGRGGGKNNVLGPIEFKSPSFPMKGQTIGVSDDNDSPSMMRKLAKSLSSALPEMDNFRLRMSSIHNAMASLIPLLLVIIGTLPALITALVGLAAAAGAAAAALLAITGLGALGVGLQDGQFSMDRLTDVWEDIKGSFIEAFAPLAEQLEPVFEDAVDGLATFFQLIANEGDALMSMVDEARGFGGFLMDFVPSMLRTLAALVNSLSDKFGDLGGFIQQNFNSIVRSLVEMTREAIPVLARIGKQIGKALPAIVQMSIGFAQITSALFWAIGVLTKFLDILGISPRLFGLVAGAVLTAATAVSLWNTALLTTARTALVTLGTKMLALISTYTSYSASTIVATAATYGLAKALLALIGIITLGVGIAVLTPVITSMASQFDILGNNIDSAANSMRKFDDISGKTNGPGFSPYGGDNPSNGGTYAGANYTEVNVESSGNDDRDKSNAKYAGWVSGRSTGSGA